MPTIVRVSAAAGGYDVHVGRGLAGAVGAPLLLDALPGPRILIVADSEVRSSVADPLAARLSDAGRRVDVAVIRAEEPRKTLPTVSGLLDAALRDRLDRGDAIVSVGGGLTGDLAGFVAAIHLRGIAVAHVPTTLLAMVDASVGGKTGVNHPLPATAPPSDEAPPVLGKNLVGAFWPPRLVLADPDTLGTLPDRQLRCGLAECIKHAVIAGEDALEQLEAEIPRLLAREPDALEAVIARSVSIKASVVAEDERESGRRAVLNLGHTFGHAIEPLLSLGLHHGEAVAIGLVAAARCSSALDRLDPSVADRIEALIGRSGLPCRLPGPVDIDRLMDAMRFDKKVLGGVTRLVLPRAIGHVTIDEDVPDDAVRAAWAAVGAA